MVEFATLPQYKEIFEDFIVIDGEAEPELAAAAVAQGSFLSKPGRWFLVEIVDEAAEDTTIIEATDASRCAE